MNRAGYVILNKLGVGINIMFIDYYKILGVARNASQDGNRKAYRKLAPKYHPDLIPNDKEAKKKFQEINEANEVLSNEANGKKYDEYGENWQHAEDFDKARQSQQQSQYTSGNPFTGFEDDESFLSFFESFLRRRRLAASTFRTVGY